MKNSIKYILSKKQKKQQDLANDRYSKQYISKVINGQFRVPVEIIAKIIELTGVPKKYFIDDKGLCKQLNSIELLEVDDFIQSQEFAALEDELSSVSYEMEIATREQALKLNIAKLQRDIRTDIHSVAGEDVSSMFDVLAVEESNLCFYREILELHKKRQLEWAEWKSLFRAFRHVSDDVSEADVKNESPLVYGMYVLMKKSRELNAIKRYKDYEVYKELFDSLLEPFDAGDE